MAAVSFDFSGAHVLVTGGTSGIGLAVAHAFLASGATVTITGTRERPSDYDSDLEGFAFTRCDLREPGAPERLADTLGSLDVLVNNAGFNLPGGRSEYEPGVFEEVLTANLVAPFRLALACKSLLAPSGVDGGGSVVGLASMSSFFGMEIVPGYGAAKAGVVQMTKTLAVAWARDGIRVNAVAPGVVESNMTAPMLGIDSLVQPILDRTPMARFAQPEEIAPAVLFLASPAARFVTGHTLVVDGGFSVQG